MMPRSRSGSGPAVAAFLAAALASGPARVRAQDAAAPPQDEAVTLDEVVVAAPPPPVQSEAAAAPGAAVTVVDASRYAGEAKGAAELLATSPGVAIADHGLGQTATVSIRGSSAEQVKVLLDGLPLNTAAGGGVDLSTIPPQWISRIEVVRGTEGVRHGSGALGGVVNVVTLPVRAGTWSGGATAGSFGTYQADVAAGTGGDRWGLLAAAAGSTSTGRFSYQYDDHQPSTPLVDRDRVHNGSALGGGLVKGFLLAGGGRLDAAAQLSGGHHDLPGWPYNPTPDDWQDDWRGLLSARFRRPLGDALVLSAGATGRLDRLDARLAELGGQVIRQRGAATGGSVGLDWSRGPGSLSVVLDGGLETLDADGLGDRARSTVAATAAGEVSFLDGRARVGPGVRVERTGGFAGVSAKLGGSVAVAGPLSVRASAGRSYRVPSLSELYLQQGIVAPNPALRPEAGIGGDAALALDGRLGTASAGVFTTLYQDLVVYEAASFRRLTPVNDAKAAVRGVEAELASAPIRRLAGLSTGLAYTFLDTENLRGAAADLGKELPRHPRHRLYARAGVGGERAEAHGEVQWISRQWLNAANTVQIPASFTVGMGGSVRITARPALRLNLEVRNLLDDRSLQDGYGNPLPGRTVLLTLRAGFPDTGAR